MQVIWQKVLRKEGGIAMEDKIGEIVTLPPHNIKARVVEVEDSGCRGCCNMDRKDCRNIIYKPLIKEN